MKVKQFIITLFMICGFTACDNLSMSNRLDKVLSTGEPFFAIRYNTLFANRFSLPTSKAVKLSNNLQAIAIEMNKINNRYTCELHLYLDDQLDIYQPEKSDYYTIKPESEYFFVREYNDKDYDWNSYVELNHMRARFLSDISVDSRARFTRTLSYNRLHRNFLSELTIVTLNTHCEIFNRVYYPANIWIQKQDVGDYLLGNDGPGEVQQKDNNYQFSIPLDLIDQIQPYIKIAVKHNYEQL